MDIRSMRVSKGLTQEQLAQKLSVKRTTVSMWENNKSLPNIIVLKKIADALDCKVDDLIKE